MTTKTGFKFGNPGTDIGTVAVSWDHLTQNYPYLPNTAKTSVVYYTSVSNDTPLSGYTGVYTGEAVWHRLSGMSFKKLANIYASGVAGIKDDGTLWVLGSNNSYGSLGVGDTAARTSWTQVGSDNTWIDIAASGATTFGLKSDGTLWSWGSNYSSGRYTYLNTGSTYTPTQVTQVWSPTLTSAPTWKALCPTSSYFYAIASDGRAFGVGAFANDYNLHTTANQGGTTSSPMFSPVRGSFNIDIKQVSNSGPFIMINNSGEAYYGNMQSFTTATAVWDPVRLPNDTGDWDQVQAMSYRNDSYYFGVKKDGTLWYWKLGGDQTWTKLSISNVKSIHVESRYTTEGIFLLTRSGRLFFWNNTGPGYYESTQNNPEDFDLKTQELTYNGGAGYSRGLENIPQGRIRNFAGSGGFFFVTLETGDF